MGSIYSEIQINTMLDLVIVCHCVTCSLQYVVYCLLSDVCRTIFWSTVNV